MKIKRFILTSAAIVITATLLVLADRHYMTVKWDGSKDVLIRFDDEFMKKEARIIGYSNDPIEYIEEMIQLYTDDQAVSIGDYPLSRKPYEENGEFVLQARGSGQRSILRKDYEGLLWLLS